MQGIQGHEGHGRGAVWVGKHSLVPFRRLGIDFGHNERHGAFHAEGGTVVDDHATPLSCNIDKLPGNVTARTENGKLQSVERFGYSFPYRLQVPADLVFASCGTLRCQKANLGNGKIPGFQQTNDFLTYGACGADDAYTIFFQWTKRFCTRVFK